MKRLVQGQWTTIWTATSLVLVLCVTSSLAATYPALAPETNHTGPKPCPTWFVNTSSGCECGHSLSNVVLCNPNTSQVSIVSGYCMTYDDSQGKTVVGYCPYNMFDSFHSVSAYKPLPHNVQNLNNTMCGHLHRRGRLCGQCISGYSPGMYSNANSCIDCTQEDYGKRLLIVLFSQFLPATILFILVVVFHINVFSGGLCAFVFFSQFISLHPAAVIFVEAGKIFSSKFLTVYSNILLTLYGVWNLDFLRPFIPDICLGKDVSVVSVVAMEYIMPLYFLFLTVVTYISIELHACGCRPVVWLWRPFHRCFVRFRRTWNVNTSIIDAFATLLLLSFAKVTCIAIYALRYVKVSYPSGRTANQLFFFFDASVKFGQGQHLPLLLVALFLLCTVVIFPIIVLVLYQFRWFQRFLHKCRLNRQGLRAFVEAFQGCYRDGADGGHDLRFFAGLYLLFRMLIIVSLGYAYGVGEGSLTSMFCIVILSLCLALTFALIRPYKRPLYNMIDTFFSGLLSVTFSAVLFLVNIELQNSSGAWFSAAYAIVLVLVSLPALYFIIIVNYWVYLKMKRKNNSRSFMQSSSVKLPDRIVHPDRYQSLSYTDTTQLLVMSESCVSTY